MSSSTVHHKFLEIFACAHVNDGFMEDDGIRMFDCFMNSQGSPLLKVKELKDKGNCLFRHNYYDRAAECYNEACKLLSLSLGIIGGEDVHSLSNLAISLNSNLAACALKLKEYKAAWDLCSIILDAFPHNVKALFRRAVASMKLKRFLKAELDLLQALEVEPRNKDVLRELEVVKGHLLIKDNGKRILEGAPGVGMDGSCKKHLHASEPDIDMKDSEGVIMEVLKDQSVVSNEIVNMEVMDAESYCGIDLNTSLKKNGHTSNKSVLEFSKKGGGNSRLRIPGQAYLKLLDGKQVSFYHERDATSITIRILNVEGPKERGTTREGCTKKKRRRCLRKRKPNKKTTVMNEDVTLSDITSVKPVIPLVSLSASASCSVSSSAPSICDNFSPPRTQILQESTGSIVADKPSFPISLVNDETISICSQAQNDPNDRQIFLFSAKPKKCKIPSFEKPPYAPTITPMLCRYPSNHHVRERRRITMCRKNHSQEDESPRHNLSTFSISRSVSHKFLRPSGVSVSCCRYSSKAQLIKKHKRKEMFVQLVSSDRPFKKPILFNPNCSLISFSNNVTIKSDSMSRVGNV